MKNKKHKKVYRNSNRNSNRKYSMKKKKRKKNISLSLLFLIIGGIFIAFTDIGNGVVLKILNKKKVDIKVDGKVIEHITGKNTLSEILDEVDITIDDDDLVNKKIGEEIKTIDEIIINRIEVVNEKVSEVIPFESKEVIDYKTQEGEVKNISQGKNGKKEVYYEIIIQDGVIKEKKVISEEILEEPVDSIIATGNFNINNYDIIVNKKNRIDRNYVPDELVTPNVRASEPYDKIMLRPEAAKHLEKLFQDAEDEGIFLYAESGYRSYEYQALIYSNNMNTGYSAQPGTSEHQLGLAMDVTCESLNGQLVEAFGETVEGQWVKENAYKYGFHIRYLKGKEDITGYYYEPWHLRYVGIDLAKELHESGLTMEEYFGEY